MPVTTIDLPVSVPVPAPAPAPAPVPVSEPVPVPALALAQKLVASPIGTLRLVATDAALVGVYFPAHRGAPPLTARDLPPDATHAVLDHAARELIEYFRGTRRTFTTPLAAAGTEFQRAVWAALVAIPFGAHRSYADLAADLGRPRAMRAIGTANGRNPLSIFVPCHRVIGADGTLVGYAGGLPAKRWLLDHEQRHEAPAG